MKDITESTNDDFSLSHAIQNLMETRIEIMMELGIFEPHTREEARRRIDANDKQIREKKLHEFDPSI